METFTGVTNCATALLQILKNYCNILNRHKNNSINNTVISKIIVSCPAKSWDKYQWGGHPACLGILITGKMPVPR